MTAINTCFCLEYLNKLVNEYNNTHHGFLVKNLLMLVILVLILKNETDHKAFKFKLDTRVRSKKHKKYF